jgi:hypothetical protein
MKEAKQFYSMPEIVESLGVPYHRVYRAVITNVGNPIQSGRSRIFTTADLLALRRYFAEREAKSC